VTLVASSPKKTQWRADLLPWGRHNLGIEAVRALQRERIAQAMLECVDPDDVAHRIADELISTSK
jgi:hypothetical protein